MHRRFGLPHAHGFNENGIITGCFAKNYGFPCFSCHAAKSSGRRRGSDVSIGVCRKGFHSGLVAKDTALRALARRVDGQHCELLPLIAEMHAQGLDEGAFARTWHTRDAQSQSLARMGQTGRDDLLGQFLMLGQRAFHQSDGLAERHAVATEDAVDVPFKRHQLLLVAAKTLQSLRVDLYGSLDTFGDLEVRLPFVLLIFKVFVFHGGLRF